MKGAAWTHDCAGCKLLGQVTITEHGVFDIYRCGDQDQLVFRYGDNGPDYLFCMPQLLWAWEDTRRLPWSTLGKIAAQLLDIHRDDVCSGFPDTGRRACTFNDESVCLYCGRKERA